MQYEHEGVEIDLSILELQTYSIDSGIDQRKPHHRTSRVWTRQAIEFDNIKSCQTIEKSAEFPYLVHIARNVANHLIPTTYGLQYNCG